MARHENGDWNLPELCENWTQVNVAVLMDIRSELQALNGKLSCYRIPRALDALIESGAEARRKKRAAAKRRKAARA